MNGTIAMVGPRQVPAGAELVDVRTPGEYAAVHAEGARLVPLSEFVPGKLAEGHKGTIYLICKSGRRAATAAEKCAAAGVSDVAVVEGGTDAWVAAGLPVVRGKGAISLERQVRIVAGLMVLAGVVLGVLVHPGFYGLSAFVGAGLVFAGLTDWCGMAMMLARMPWNRAPRGAECSSTGKEAC
jgi:rhodanese-related sulfurtransferase